MGHSTLGLIVDQPSSDDRNQAENARAQQHHGARLWTRPAGAAVQREGFAADAAVAKIGTALPEVASRRAAETAVRDVPRLRTIAGGVGGIADGEPVRVTGVTGLPSNGTVTS